MHMTVELCGLCEIMSNEVSVHVLSVCDAAVYVQ